MNYYVLRAGQQYGPYAMSDLQRMAAEGRIQATDLVWGEGFAGWVPAGQVLGSLPPPATRSGAPAPAAPPPGEGVYMPPMAQPTAYAAPGTMGGADFDLGIALSEGWQTLQRNMGTAVLGTLVFMILNLIGSLIPILSYLYVFLISGPFTAGLMILYLKLADNKGGSVSDVFAGFGKYGRYLGVFWLIFLIAMAVEVVALIPLGGGLLVMVLSEQSGGFQSRDETATIIMFVFLGLLTLGLLIVGFARFLTPYVFSYFVVADGLDDNSATGALRRSAALVGNRRTKLFLTVLLFSLIGAAGLLALCVGYLFTAPWMGCAIASIYRQLRGGVALKPSKPPGSMLGL